MTQQTDPVTAPPKKIATGDSSDLLKGVDTDHYVGYVDAAKVASSGIGFLIAKATQGVSFVDPQFSRTWKSCNLCGLTRGAYHFFEARVDGAQQAKHFTDTLSAVGGLRGGDLPAVVDVEYDSLKGWHGSRESLITNLRKTIVLLTGRYGRAPIIYSSPGFISEWLDDSFTACPLWVARYARPGAVLSGPGSVAPWADWVLWQRSPGEEGGHIVPGIAASVDVDVFRGTHADLMKRFSAPDV